MMRVVSRRSVPMLGLLLVLAVPATAERGMNGFRTNLAVLDQLTKEAISAVLDSLSFKSGESVTIVVDGNNEGNQFVGDAFARALARQGCIVRLALESAPAAGEAAVPEGRPESAPAGGADSTKASGDSTSVQTTPPASGASGGLATIVQEDSTGLPPLPPPKSKVEQPPSDMAKAGTGTGTGTGTGAGTGTGTGTGTGAEKPVGKPGEATPIPAPTWKMYPAGTVLEFHVLEFGVNYPQVKRHLGLFGIAAVTRLGGVYVEAKRIEGSDGRIIDATTGQSHSQDRLAGHARTLAEGANYPFAKPVVPPANVGRLVEPILVIGIVASLVYLFYQNQH